MIIYCYFTGVSMKYLITVMFSQVSPTLVKLFSHEQKNTDIRSLEDIKVYSYNETYVTLSHLRSKESRGLHI